MENQYETVKFRDFIKEVWNPSAGYTGDRIAGSGLTVAGNFFSPQQLGRTVPTYTGQMVELQAKVLAEGEFERRINTVLSEDEFKKLAEAYITTLTSDGRHQIIRDETFSVYREQIQSLIISGLKLYAGDKARIIQEMIELFRTNDANAGTKYGKKLEDNIKKALDGACKSLSM
ncbi:MAG: hypothetical protein SFW07_02865 [Gammaproteobacteria bacterium]|nr:hypothetical protein [Gammaproteobacteria bacterium]